jgi:uncharacterized protein (TIGR03663 family)
MVLALAIAAAFRLPALAERPMHCDEANQAVKTGVLFDTGRYAYDPHEHHGPTLYYFALPILELSGAKDFAATREATYRLVPVVFGIGLIALLALLRPGLGTAAVLWAALFTAVSHAMVYYSRYYVHEMLLVSFTFGAIASGWRYWRHPRVGWAVATGLCLGLMHATKETCVIIYAAMAMALILTAAMARYGDGADLRLVRRVRAFHVVLGLAVGAAVSVLFFSSFFTYARGPLDSLLTFITYLYRAEGAGSSGLHDKPWYYYLHVLLYYYRAAGPRWTEALVVGLSLAGALYALFRKPHDESPQAQPESGPSIGLLRFLAFYTLLLTVAFSIIPYKTPWNLLVFFHGMILLAGVGAAALVRACRLKALQAVVCVLLLAATGHAARQTYLGNFLYAADDRNPYVYAHTSTALMRLVHRIDDIAQLSPEPRQMQINIIKPDGDYWPLPWYLRGYERVGYWTQIPDPADAPMIITDPRLGPEIKEHLRQSYFEEYHGLRPGVLLQTYIRQDLWDAFMQSRSQPAPPGN